MIDLFKGPTSEEVRKRRKVFIKEWGQKLKSFKNREDVFQRADGSFDVRGDVEDWCSKDFKYLALKYGRVIGNYSCGGGLDSLKGAPRLIGGNFSFHGELKSLKGFPKEVCGNVEFINHPIPANKRNAKRWKAADIRKICKKIWGKISVGNHHGI